KRNTMATEVKVPQISEGVETATVTEILVSEGDTIEKDQSIIAVESDKAAVEIPSSHAGKVKSINVSEDDEINVGDVILTLEEAEDDEGEEDEKESKEESDEEGEKEKSEDEAEGEEEESDGKEKSKKKAAGKEEDEDQDEEAKGGDE